MNASTIQAIHSLETCAWTCVSMCLFPNVFVCNVKKCDIHLPYLFYWYKKKDDPCGVEPLLSSYYTPLSIPTKNVLFILPTNSNALCSAHKYSRMTEFCELLPFVYNANRFMHKNNILVANV